MIASSDRFGQYDHMFDQHCEAIVLKLIAIGFIWHTVFLAFGPCLQTPWTPRFPNIEPEPTVVAGDDKCHIIRPSILFLLPDVGLEWIF